MQPVHFAPKKGMMSSIIKASMQRAHHKGMLRRGIIVFLMTTAMLGRNAAAADPRLYQDSIDALYSLDFSTAERGFETLTREDPANPEYWNALASTIWLKIIYDQQKLNIESFSGSSLGTRDSSEVIDPAVEKRLRDTLAVAMEKSNAILRKTPNDVKALYSLGISNATLASFEGTAKRKYLAAHSKAKEAKKLHERVLEIDAAYHDARLAVGTYDYVVGVIPRVIRFLIAPFGIRGNGKDAGIRSIETAAAQGRQIGTEARMVLIVVYNREKRFDQALRLAGELHARYPRNFLFELSKASIYGKMNKWDEAAYVYEQVLAKAAARRDGYERVRPEKIYYDLGNADIHRMQFDDAVGAFQQVVNSSQSTANEKAGSHLWIGKIYDSEKKRAKALEQYAAILALNCSDEFKDEARRYRKTPFVG
jgi:tetratricopeptide (TPR) repeat protein